MDESKSNGNGSAGQGGDDAKRSLIQFEFQGLGSAAWSFRSQNVSADQMLIAAKRLERFAEQMIYQEEMARAQAEQARHIAVPGRG